MSLKVKALERRMECRERERARFFRVTPPRGTWRPAKVRLEISENGKVRSLAKGERRTSSYARVSELPKE